MKTLKQIADNLGIPKQKVYRYIKDNHIIEVQQNSQTKWYDDSVEERVKSAFFKKTTTKKSGSEPLYDALIKQLELKDEQIARLQNLLENEQKLNAINQDRILALEVKTKRRHFWSKKRRQD